MIIMRKQTTSNLHKIGEDQTEKIEKKFKCL